MKREQDELLESQKMIEIQKVLADSSPLKKMLTLIRAVTDKHNDFAGPSFIGSNDFQFLLGQINQVEIPELTAALATLAPPTTIVALPVKKQPKFTLFFVLVPKNQKFDWHSHPHMTGISKCLYGHLDMTAVNVGVMQRLDKNTYLYPKDQLRKESLFATTPNRVSTIDPTRMNVHKIEAKTFSAFFDLLMPDYPDNTCNFFRTISEDEHQLVLQELAEPEEEVRGWDVAINDLLKEEKYRVRNVILQ